MLHAVMGSITCATSRYLAPQEDRRSAAHSSLLERKFLKLEHVNRIQPIARFDTLNSQAKVLTMGLGVASRNHLRLSKQLGISRHACHHGLVKAWSVQQQDL